MESFGTTFVCVLAIAAFQSCQAASWSYLGSSDGVNKWASNYPGQCDGSKQSPIDLKSSVASYDSSLAAFSFSGFASTSGVAWTLSNNGHTVQVTYTSGALTVSGGSLGAQYTVAQFHFHWGAVSTKGSEHVIDGSAYPMEVHVVCFKSSYGDLGSAVASGNSDALAVLGFFFEISSNDNPTIQKIVDELPSVNGAGNTTSMTPFALDDMIAGVSDYYRYQGGLTTPTCNEIVTWTVFRETIKLSETQMAAFRSVKDSHNQDLVDNFRPPQGLGSRTITASWDDPKFSGASGLMLSSLALLASLLVSFLSRL